jgi:hypothetical protein
MRSKLGEILREERERVGLTQRELAQLRSWPLGLGLLSRKVMGNIA